MEIIASCLASCLDVVAVLETYQCAKKVVSDSPGLVDFDDGQAKVFEEFKLQKNCEINSAHQNVFGASWNDVWASIC